MFNLIFNGHMEYPNYIHLRLCSLYYMDIFIYISLFVYIFFFFLIPKDAYLF